jgi:hypothetical protein
MLLKFHTNGHDNETAYAQPIRNWLTNKGGRPGVARRGVANSYGVPSLR